MSNATGAFKEAALQNQVLAQSPSVNIIKSKPKCPPFAKYDEVTLQVDERGVLTDDYVNQELFSTLEELDSMFTHTCVVLMYESEDTVKAEIYVPAKEKKEAEKAEEDSGTIFKEQPGNASLDLSAAQEDPDDEFGRSAMERSKEAKLEYLAQQASSVIQPVIEATPLFWQTSVTVKADNDDIKHGALTSSNRSISLGQDDVELLEKSPPTLSNENWQELTTWLSNNLDDKHPLTTELEISVQQHGHMFSLRCTLWFKKDQE